MSSTGWRNLCFGLAALCIAQAWRSCGAAPELAADAACPATSPAASGAAPAPTGERTRAVVQGPAPGAARDDAPELAADGFTAPAWMRWLAPQPGEDLRAYRDRMVPIAQAVVAPQRARVARSRDSFAELAQLDAHQRGELDRAARDAAAAIRDRVVDAVMSGELAPAVFKPMAGVTVARDLLDIVDRGNRRFVGALRDDQRGELADHPFDFGDYLVFSTRWEDAFQLFD